VLYVRCEGLLRDAEQQLRSSLKIQPVINTYLELCNVYLRLDVPNTALDLLIEARCVAYLLLHLPHAVLNCERCVRYLSLVRSSRASRAYCWDWRASTTC
jgi:hypothetical protein